ncbi:MULTISPECIES: aspartate aminotransferase family protein [Paraburkholderia]|uniref:aspartate aminotransferase family protein n=1 Tax=Paraburkholderia TaxID=1822464 RepID=UPI000722F994|nr:MULTISPECIES: aspartate aminotransferase family protein [Paraburkholderia]ALP66015.1 glutamate-1-semialdehyde 2,1-aminomutase [Paraburkholderia caribensis]AUT55055.1 aspartate aminotransferase family protein [Paraburkholderia caribensis]CAG9213424.1 Beta-phenylalanine transaminase [Paraburkholderia caribensis]
MSITNVLPSQPDMAELRRAASLASGAFAKSNPKSEAAHLEALSVMPGGNTRSVLFYSPFPLTIARGEGKRLWDVDGHAYTDFLAEYTTAMYGHSHPVIRAAVVEALDNGLNLTGHNTLEVPLARLLQERFDSVESLRFTNSGTESNLMAIAASLIFTGRKKVIALKGGYHGGVLTFGSGNSAVNVPHDFVVVPYNDLSAVEAVFATHGDEIAAVIVEPMQVAGGCIVGEPEFLKGLRALTQRHDALLIFDEVVTSRLSGGGRQALLGIRPDLTTFGKYIGGGMSFGAFGGRKDVMAQFDPRLPGATPHAGTFNNNVLSMAAGYAGLSRLYTPGAAAALNEKGERLRARINGLCRERHVAMQFTGIGSLMNLHAGTQPIHSVDDLSEAETPLKDLFFFHMTEHGCYVARRGFIVLTLAHDEADLQRLEEAVTSFIDRYEALLRA